jgi:hypothetical protein
MCSWVWLGFVEKAMDGANKRQTNKMQTNGQKQKEQKLVKEVFGSRGVRRWRRLVKQHDA